MDEKTTTLFRTILPEHINAFGVDVAQMPEQAGLADCKQILRSRSEVDTFEEMQGVDTTPKVCIDEQRVVGSDDLARDLERD